MPKVPDNVIALPSAQPRPEAPPPTYLMMAAAVMHEQGKLFLPPPQPKEPANG